MLPPSVASLLPPRYTRGIVRLIRVKVYRLIIEFICHKGQSVARQEVAEGEGRESFWECATRVFLRSCAPHSCLFFDLMHGLISNAPMLGPCAEKKNTRIAGTREGKK